MWCYSKIIELKFITMFYSFYTTYFSSYEFIFCATCINASTLGGLIITIIINMRIIITFQLFGFFSWKNKYRWLHYNMLSCIGLYLNRMLGLQMNTIYTGTWEQFFTITLVFERVPEITVHQIITTKNTFHFNHRIRY